MSRKQLEEIRSYVNMVMADPGYDPHASTIEHFNKILYMTMNCDKVASPCTGEINRDDDDEPATGELKIIISCDASITKNPGGKAATGVVIRLPDTKPLVIARHCHAKTTTNNQAEYDAVYESLMYIEGHIGSFLSKQLPIDIRSDSKLVVNHLNGTWNCNDEGLKNKYELVKDKLAELALLLGQPVKVVWFARNSTQDLKWANNAAQDELNIKNH